MLTRTGFVEQDVWDSYLKNNLAVWAKDNQIPVNAEGLAETSKLEALGYVQLDSPYAEMDQLWVQRGETKRVVQTVLKQGKIDNKFVEGMERFNAWSKVARLTFSAFHHVVLIENLIAATGDE